MTQPLTAAEQAKLLDGICPDCGSRTLIAGPRGSLARNLLCGQCRIEFNANLRQSTRLGPCGNDRLAKLYHITRESIPIGAFNSSIPLTRKLCDDTLLAARAQIPADHPISPQLQFRSQCHPHAGLCAWYKDGLLVLNCMECQTLVLKISVAP